MRLAELSMRLKTLCRYYALLGRVQTTSLTSGFDLRYFYTAEFFPKKAVLREYVTEFTFIFLNPIEKNEEKYSGVVKKRTN